MADAKISALASHGTPVAADYVASVLDSGPTSKKLLLSDLRKYTSQSYTPGGRLTLESGVPVSTTDQTAKTTIYYTPYIHNIINLWDGANWAPTEFTETSLALGTITSGKPYDVFGYVSAGALVLELLAWTNDTTRATAVTLQDGRYCKSGDKTRLLLGTFYTASTTTTTDSENYRYLDNVYNRVSKQTSMILSGAASNTYSSTTVRAWNADTTARFHVVQSLPSSVFMSMYFTATTSYAVGGFGVNSTTTASGLIVNPIANWSATLGQTRSISAGYSYIALLQYAYATADFSYPLLIGQIQC